MLDQATRTLTPDLLEPLVGEWDMLSGERPLTMGGRTTFEWLDGRQFLIQRFHAEIDRAPSDMAIIGLDPFGDRFVQHHFDSRGVARKYMMELRDGVWTLWRHADAPDVSQRWLGRFSPDGGTIWGAWETSFDGRTWGRDFELVYQRRGRPGRMWA